MDGHPLFRAGPDPADVHQSLPKEAATTVLALLPLTLGTGEGAELREPMAVTIIGGILASSGRRAVPGSPPVRKPRRIWPLPRRTVSEVHPAHALFGRVPRGVSVASARTARATGAGRPARRRRRRAGGGTVLLGAARCSV